MCLNGSEYPELDEAEHELCDKPLLLEELDAAITLINIE